MEDEEKKEEFDGKLCGEKHENIKEKIIDNEKRLNNHSHRLDKLEQRAERVDTKIESLCDQIKNLVSTLKWGFGIILTVTLFVLGYLIKIK